MKTKQSCLLLLLAIAFPILFAAGCANTASGISKDYHKAEDKVESVTK